jgi:glycosyltransferase involved in cell wall biosynthesis
MTTRVLIYSPYSLWYLHSTYDAIFAHALKLRGAEVRVVACDGVFPACDVRWENTGAKASVRCADCAATGRQLQQGMQLAGDWLRQYLPPGSTERAQAWVASLADTQLVDATHAGYPLGRWVKSSVHSHFRMSQLDLTDPSIAAAYREYLLGACLALEAMQRLLDEFRPDALLMLNGRFFSHRVLLELARERGIRLFAHERGRLDHTLTFWENESCHSFATFTRAWQAWRDLPLAATELERVAVVLGEREHGRNTGWKSFAHPKDDIAVLSARLGLSAGVSLVTLFTSSDDEMIASEGWETVIDQFEWIVRSIRYFAARPEYQLVIRVHPNTAGVVGANQQFLDRIGALIAAGLPANVRVILPQEPVNSYQLIALSRACLVFSSTIGLECAVRGRPVLMCGGGVFYGNDWSLNLPQAVDYESWIARLLADTAAPARLRSAWRFAYHHFVRMSVPFPLVTVQNTFHAQLNFSDTAALLPGRDAALDSVCGFVLDGRPVYAGPTTRAVGDSAEQAFLRRLDTTAATPELPVPPPATLKLTVIVPTYNRQAILHKCLDALARQTLSATAFEVIVCDDGSTDGTAAFLATYQAPFALKVLRQDNGGPAAARNLGIRAARGEYLLFLNDDTIAADDLLATHVATHQTYRDDKLAVLGRFEFLPEHRATPFGFLLEHSEFLFYYRRMTPGGRHDYQYFWTCNLSVRRAAVIEAGAFDEAFDVPAAEDLDLGYRLQKLGYQVLYQPACRAWHDHRITPQGYCRTQQVRGKGAAMLYRKHPELATFPLDAQACRTWESSRADLAHKAQAALDYIVAADVALPGASADVLDAAAKRLGPSAEVLSHFHWLDGLIRATAAPAAVKAPRVSVVVTCYNYGRYLDEAVQSVFDQTHRDLEILIVNDGSTDNTRDVADALAQRDVRVRVIHQANSGQPAISRNNGIAAARGELILCLDADDKLAPAMIEECLRLLDADPALAIAYTDRADFGLIEQIVTAGEYDFAELKDHNLISYCALYRRQVWQDVGGYRTNVKGCEDWDFWVAAGARGYRGRRLAQPLFCYRQHGTGLYQHALQNSDRKRAQIILNNAAAYSEHDRDVAQRLLALLDETTARSATLTVTEQPLVSVILPTKDRPALLQDALASLVAQDYPHWEAIVVNDGGADITTLAQAADPQGRVRVIAHATSRGLPAARNTGLEQARGEIICYLDDDDLYRQDHLATVVAAMRQGAAVVYVDCERVTEELTPAGRSERWRDRPYAYADFSLERLFVTNYIPIITCAHHRDCLTEAGLFDEALPLFEDWDFLLRLAQKYTPVRLAPITVEIRVREPRVGDNLTSQRKARVPEVYEKLCARYRAIETDHVRAKRAELLDLLRKGVAAEAAPATAPAASGEEYQRWRTRHSLTEMDGQLFAERMLLRWARRPQIDLLLPVAVGEEPLLAQTLAALANQMYPHWRLTVLAALPPPATSPLAPGKLRWLQLDPQAEVARELNQCVARSDAHWVALVPAGWQPEPQLLLRCGDYIDQKRAWRLIYTDSDRATATGERVDPAFRPDMNPDLLRAAPYLGEFCVVERTALLEAGGYGDALALANHDLALRLLERQGEAALGHISDVLYAMPAGHTPAFTDADLRAVVEGHLARHGVVAQVLPGYQPRTLRVLYAHAQRPRVSVIVPTRDRLDLLRPCLDSLLEKTAYDNYELIVVDNASREPATLDYFRALTQRHPTPVRILAYPQPFNYAAISNLAARAASGDYLLFLNNDTLVLHADWLERMLAHGQRPGVGIVGPRLVLPGGGQLQHAGLILGMNEIAEHVFSNVCTLNDPGYLGRAQLDQNLSAVTGACLLIRRSVYEQVGGMDEQALPVSFNDVDLCLKVRAAGYQIVYTPYVTLLHHGGATRISDGADTAVQARQLAEYGAERDVMLTRWLPQLANDPAYNRHLSLGRRDAAVEDVVVINWDPAFHDRPRLLGNSPTGGSAEYRVAAPLRALSNAGRVQSDLIETGMIRQTRVLSVTELARTGADTLLLHSAISDMELAALERYRRFNDMRLVFGLDDLVTNLPAKNSFHAEAKGDAAERLRRALACCDSLVVSTAPLAELCRGMIGDIRIVPNRLERAVWGEVQPATNTSARPRVGWAGAQQHQGDLELMQEVVRATAHEVDWVFFGMCPVALRPYVREVHSFVIDFRQYPRKLAGLNLDLAVAPLELHPFNEAKSNLRLLEYGWMGWPVVCTDILPYQEAPVCRVANDPARWIEAIRARVHDRDAARREGAQLRAWVQERYVLEDHLDDWYGALVPAKWAQPRSAARRAAAR